MVFEEQGGYKGHGLDIFVTVYGIGLKVKAVQYLFILGTVVVMVFTVFLNGLYK